MILGFNSRFKALILKGEKQHTIRRDEKKKWKNGCEYNILL